eukprot:tig00000955_g5803.t1
MAAATADDSIGFDEEHVGHARTARAAAAQLQPDADDALRPRLQLHAPEAAPALAKSAASSRRGSQSIVYASPATGRPICISPRPGRRDAFGAAAAAAPAAAAGRSAGARGVAVTGAGAGELRSASSVISFTRLARIEALREGRRKYKLYVRPALTFAFLAFACGLTYLKYRLMINDEEQLARLFFLATAENAIQAVENQWTRSLMYLELMANHYVTQNGSVSRSEFADFANPDRLVRAGGRPLYFPVQFIEPYKGNEAALGFDLYSNAERRAAIDKARTTGAQACTPRITLVQSTKRQYGVIVFEPLFFDAGTGRVGRPFRGADSLHSFIDVVYKLDEMLAASAGGITLENLDLFLYDVTSSPPAFLAHLAGISDGNIDSGDYTFASLSASHPDSLQGDIREQDDFAAADRRWRIIADLEEGSDAEAARAPARGAGAYAHGPARPPPRGAAGALPPDHDREDLRAGPDPDPIGSPEARRASAGDPPPFDPDGKPGARRPPTPPSPPFADSRPVIVPLDGGSPLAVASSSRGELEQRPAAAPPLGPPPWPALPGGSRGRGARGERPRAAPDVDPALGLTPAAAVAPTFLQLHDPRPS